MFLYLSFFFDLLFKIFQFKLFINQLLQSSTCFLNCHHLRNLVKIDLEADQSFDDLISFPDRSFRLQNSHLSAFRAGSSSSGFQVPTSLKLFTGFAWPIRRPRAFVIFDYLHFVI